MGVRADGDPDAHLCRAPGVGVLEVQALPRGVDLHRLVVLLRRGEDLFEVHVVGVALADESSRGVDEDVHAGMGERPDDARRHLGPRLLEPRVDGRQHHVQLGKEVIREIHAPVGQDVALAPGEDADPVLRLERPDARDLLAQLLGREPARHRRGARVVGDDDVLVAARLGLGHQPLERQPPVGPVRVGVQVPADVLRGDEVRQTAAERRLDLARVLAQLGRDPRQADRLVDLRLRGAADPLSRPLAEHPVLRDLEPLLLRDLPEAHVVVLGAGEVLERGAVGLGRDHSKIHLQGRGAGVRPAFDGGLGVAVGEHGLHHGKADEAIDDALGVPAGDEDVEVSHGLAPPAGGSGDLDGGHLPRGSQRLQDLLRAGQRQAQRETLLAGAQRAEAGQDVLAGLGADARHAEDVAGGHRLLELLHAVDAEVPVEELGGLGADAAHREDLEEPARELGSQRVELGDAPGLEVLRDVGGEALADAGDGRQLASRGDARHVLGEALEVLGGALVGADAEDVLALDLEELRDLGEESGDLRVLHAPMVSWRSAVRITTSPHRSVR